MTVLGKYAVHMERRGLAVNTQTRRMIALRGFDNWLAPRSILGASRQTVEVFLDTRRGVNGKKIEARSRYCWLSHLHCFYEWAMAEDIIDRDPTARIIRPKLKKTLPRPISEEDLAVALACGGAEMSAWMALGGFAGLRCAEISALDADHVLTREGLLLVHGKGNKQRTVPIHPVVDEALGMSGLPRSGPVFRRPRGGRYPPTWVSRRGNMYLAGLGISATMHQLRHRFGTEAYKACRDIRVVQELMGHSSPVVTSGYVAFSRAEAKRAVLSLPAVGSRQEPLFA